MYVADHAIKWPAVRRGNTEAIDTDCRSPARHEMRHDILRRGTGLPPAFGNPAGQGSTNTTILSSLRYKDKHCTFCKLLVRLRTNAGGNTFICDLFAMATSCVSFAILWDIWKANVSVSIENSTPNAVPRTGTLRVRVLLLGRLYQPLLHHLLPLHLWLIPWDFLRRSAPLRVLGMPGAAHLLPAVGLLVLSIP